MWMCNVSHTNCLNGPSALVPNAVVIRCRIVKMLFVFLLSDTLSKLIVRYQMLQMQTLELHVYFAFLSTCLVARKVLLYN